jgi:hypothetical protein
MVVAFKCTMEAPPLEGEATSSLEREILIYIYAAANRQEIWATGVCVSREKQPPLSINNQTHEQDSHLSVRTTSEEA